jgi:membrane fusion protein (multidrug efflux system)
MWVYFNVPEARYLEYRDGLHQVVHVDGAADPGSAAGTPEELQIELVLANGNKFNERGAISAVEADFNNETGNIAFRADFPNPAGLLRHGQTGTVLLHRELQNALVIPQRATFEILDKRYVYVVDKDNVARQREIEVEHELEDIYVIKDGLQGGDKIVLEGVRQVRDGDKLKYEFRGPDLVLNDLKNVAE